MALQLFLDKEVGGFTNKPNRLDSFDGKFGTFTLGRLEEYFKKIHKVSEPNKPKPSEPDKFNAPFTQKTHEVLSRLAPKEKFRPENTFYSGDSLMYFILRGRKINKSNRRAIGSSHLVKTKQFDTKKYRRNHIFVEEEALKYLENPECKLLVINGGVNDLYSRYPSETVVNQIIRSFERIIKKAHEKGVKVAVYTLNAEVAPKGRSLKTIQLAKKASYKINKWLAEKSGTDVILDTDKIVNGRLRADRLHPTSRASKDLYAALSKTVQSA